MTQLSERCRRFLPAVAMALALFAGAATASPTYQSVALTYAQTGLAITDAGGGLRRWDVEASVTNNTGVALNDVNFWLLGLLLNTGNGLLPALWNNGAQRFESTEAMADPDGNTAFLSWSDSDLAVPPSSMIDPGDSLAAWSLGTLGVGQTVTFHWAFLSEAAVLEVRPNTDDYIGFTTTVPEPASLALAGLALLALAAARRRAA